MRSLSQVKRNIHPIFRQKVSSFLNTSVCNVPLVKHGAKKARSTGSSLLEVQNPQVSKNRLKLKSSARKSIPSTTVPQRLMSSSPLPALRPTTDAFRLGEKRENESKQEVDFSQPEIIYKRKGTAELLRGLFILQLSGYDAFVQNSMKLMTIGQRVLGKKLFDVVMRRTFFGQFAIEPFQEKVENENQRLQECGIASIFAVTAEEDVGEEASDQFNEDRYDRNVDSMLYCLELTDQMCRTTTTPKLTQLKVTSYMKADVLAKISEVLKRLNGYLTRPGSVNLYNFVRGLNGQMENIPELSEDEMQHLRRALLRFDQIAKEASEKNIHVLVDAEKVNINPCLDLIAMAMMKKFNTKKALIWNTYQCYLKETQSRLKRHAELADEESICFGVKLVRGAYMDGERHAAESKGEEVPVNDSYEATNVMYDAMVEYLMHRSVRPSTPETRFIIATHNEESIHKAISLMKHLDLPSCYDKVTFGQLYGMCDHVSYALGQAGYLVYKSVVVGPVEDVLLYLSRRAQENNTVFHRLQKEKRLLGQEIRRRLF